MGFGSDIHVFICIGFVLVDLFDEQVYSFCDGGYLSDEDLGVLAFQCEMNLTFIDCLELVKHLNCFSWRIL